MICPNCHNQIPDNSPVCPMCGTNFTYGNMDNRTQMMPQPPRPQPANKTLLISVIAIACVLICAIIVLAVIYVSDDNKAQTEQTEQIGQTQTADGLDPAMYDWLGERKVTAEDLSGKTAGDLRLMRNSIFARHGYIFKSDDLTEYFSNFPWYKPTTPNVNNLLSPLEKENIAYIKKFEGGDTATAPAPKKQSAPAKVDSSYDGVDYTDLVMNYRLSGSDLAGYNKTELRLMRNTIYARHGYIFKSADLRAHFSRFSWYVPQYREIPLNYLSELERHNIELIKSYE